VIEAAWFYFSYLAFSKIVLIDIFETAFLKTVVMKLIYFQIMV